MANYTILVGDCREQMRGLPAGHFHAAVTSPPYWGLRDYGCDGQLGLEATPEAYIAGMVEVFREVRRVLRDDGTLWLNIGDCYAQNEIRNRNGENPEFHRPCRDGVAQTGRKQKHGLKPKDLVGIPWRLAFALQADGWVLRQEIVWSKANPMPESVRDRCTKAHEQVFMFCKAKWGGPPNGRFSHVGDSDARWVAALVDAEGCIVVKRVRHEGRGDTFAPQVSIGSTCRALLDRVASIFRHGSVLERPGKNAPMHYWQVGNNIAADFLRRIYPFLIVKPRQARIGIYVDSLTYYRGGKKPERKQRTDAELAILDSLWARNKACNHFRNPDLSDVPEPEYGGWRDCERYFYDAEAIKEPSAEPGRIRNDPVGGASWEGRQQHDLGGVVSGTTTRNRRTVWEIPTQPFPEAHFATFPEALVLPCVLAGTSEKGCCAACGRAVERAVERAVMVLDRSERTHPKGRTRTSGTMVEPARSATVGWNPACDCGSPIVPCRVLDPFGGSGTTAAVACQLGREATICELNPEYAAMAERRIGEALNPATFRDERDADAPLFKSTL